MILFREIIFLLVCGTVLGTDPVTVFEANGKYRLEIADNVSFKFYGKNSKFLTYHEMWCNFFG